MGIAKRQLGYAAAPLLALRRLACPIPRLASPHPLSTSSSPRLSRGITTTATLLPPATSQSSSLLSTASPHRRATLSLVAPPPTARFSHTHSKPAAMVAENYEQVLTGKYPGKAHVKRVVDLIRKQKADANGVLYLEGSFEKLLEDNDSPQHFRQRRYFYYLTGCNLADCHYAYDIQSAKSTLFIPPIDPADVIWSGLPVSIDDALSMYDVDEVKLTSEVNETLTKLAAQNPKSTVFAIKNQISNHVNLDGFANKDVELLKPAIEVSRVIKDEFEVAMIRKANHISGMGHKAAVQRAKWAKNEMELEAAFLERCVAHGAKEMAYHPIVAGGRAAATLHYVPNNAPLAGKQNVLIDAGGEWNNYASDITRTFPLTDKFTKESRAIYDIVFKMQKDCIAMVKADGLWDDVHLHAHRIAIDGLLSLGILKGDREEILEAQTSAAFFPHGLGHHLGLDTHDTGGNPNREDPNMLFRYLRLRGHTPAGSVVTVEPGIYFCEFIIKPYLKEPKHCKFIDADVLDKYWDVGGVRIEDNILITENGPENLTDAIKEPGEIEALIQASTK